MRTPAGQPNEPQADTAPAKTAWQWLMPIALATLAISPAQAQKTKPAVIQSQGHHQDTNETTPSSASLPAIQITIKGAVVDQTNGRALSSVKLLLQYQLKSKTIFTIISGIFLSRSAAHSYQSPQIGTPHFPHHRSLNTDRIKLA